MAEVHPDPAVALSDSAQQMDIPQFNAFIDELQASGLYKKINSKYERQRRAMFQCSSFFLFRTFGVNDESTSAMNNSFNLFSYNLCYDFKVKLINVLYNIEERNDDKLHAFFA